MFKKPLNDGKKKREVLNGVEEKRAQIYSGGKRQDEQILTGLSG